VAVVCLAEDLAIMEGFPWLAAALAAVAVAVAVAVVQ
jgi:hypothetical protein